MQRITSAYANKLLRSLQEEKEFWEHRKASSCTYTAALIECPVIPTMIIRGGAATIAEIDGKICAIKHAVNLNNALVSIQVGGKEMTADSIFIRVAQLNKRKHVLEPEGIQPSLPA